MKQMHMSAKEYQEMLRKGAKKTSKHHNKYVYIYEDGFVANDKGLQGHGRIVEKFDSIKEYQRGKELELLARAGRISELKKQVPLLIQEAFDDAHGKHHRATYYKADFMYIQDGETVVEDVKGVDKDTGKARMTEAFQLKWKLLQARYPYVFRIY